MNRKFYFAIVCLIACILQGCVNSNVEEAPINLPSKDKSVDKNVIKIKYTEEGGVKIIPVKVNGESLNMVYDPGSSGVQISYETLKSLYNKGLIDDIDFVGTANFRIADGTVVENLMVVLHTIEIDPKIRLHEVEAGVPLKPNAPLLLGNGALDQFASVTVDTKEKTINFKKN